MKLPCPAQGESVLERAARRQLRRRKPVAIVIVRLSATVVPLLLASGCVQQAAETEIFPGYVFGEGKNNMLNYPEDPGRTEYSGERLNVRFKDQMANATSEYSDLQSAPPDQPHNINLGDALAEISRSTRALNDSAAIRPSPLISGDVELQDMRTSNVRSVINTAPNQTNGREQKTAKSIEPGTLENWQTALFLASYRSNSAAEAGWHEVSQRFADPLKEFQAKIVEVDLGSRKGGIYFRLFAAPMDGEEQARAVCQVLAKSNQFCRVATAGGRIKW